MTASRRLPQRPRRRSAAGGLFAGLLYPFQALALLNRTPRLWGYVLVPVLVNIIVGLTLYVGLLVVGWRAIDALVLGLPAWAALLAGLLRVLLIIILLIATGFVLVQFGVTLGAPWYIQLSAQLEQVYTGVEAPPGSSGVGGMLRDLGRAVVYALQKLSLVAIIALLVLLLNIIPVAGQILATVGWIALGATNVCMDVLDPPLERRYFSFRAKLAAIHHSLPASASFGLVCLALVSIPLVNLFTIPLCVAAGTLFCCDWVLPEAER